MALNIITAEKGDYQGDVFLSCEVNDGKQTVTARLSEKQKDGTLFPNFASISSGSVIEGNLWQSAKGYWYIFPPKPETAKKGGFGGGNVSKLMDKKNESIEKHTDRKEEGIKISSTMRDAVLCAIAEYNKDKTDLSSLPELIEKWREFLWMHWDVETTKYPPFN